MRASQVSTKPDNTPGPSPLHSLSSRSVDRRKLKRLLGEDLFHHASMDVSEPEVAPAVPIRQPCVIQAHQVKDGSVQIVNMYGVVLRFKAEIVGAAVSYSTFHSSAG